MTPRPTPVRSRSACRAREERELSPLAARSYPAPARRARGRLRPAHAVPARPRPDRSLQGVPPPQAQDAGLRRARGRPLPHAADAHARGHRRSRARWRARSRLNEDLAEAIGLGHDLGHPPFGHIGEDVLDRCLRERFGGALPPLGAVAARRRRARARRARPQPHRAGPRRHPLPLRAARPSRRRSRGRSCASPTASPISTTTSTTRCAPACSTPRRCPREAIAVLGDTGSTRIDALVHDLVEHSERAGRDRAGRARPRRRWRRCATFMFERRLPRPESRGASTPRSRRVVAVLFEHYCAHPERARRRRGEDLATRVTDYIAGMTDRYCIRAYEELAVPRAFARLMARYTDDSKERVRDAVDMVDLVGARTELRRVGRGLLHRACARSTTSARRRSASTRRRRSTTASAARRRATPSTS